MWTSSALRFDSGGLETQRNKSMQGRTTLKSAIRSTGSNKNLSRWGLWTALPKVIEDGIPHSWQQGKVRIYAGLRMANSKCLASPPHVLQPESCNLSCAQSIAGQQGQDCKVTETFGGAIFARHFQKYLDIFRPQYRGNVFECVEPRNDDCRTWF